MFSIVTNVELVKVNDPDTLFAAAAAAGIPFMEVSLGMVWADDGPYLRVEVTRRVPKAKASKAKAGSKRFKGWSDGMIAPVGNPGSEERLEALAVAYSAQMEKAEEDRESPFYG